MKKKLLNMDTRIAQDMILKIQKGEWKTGERLPSERELALLFGAQRNTIRLAAKILVDEGLLEVRNRSGYYVAAPKLLYQAGRILDFEEVAGPSFAWTSFETREIAAEGELAERIQVEPGRRVRQIFRVGAIGGRKCCMERWTLIASKALARPFTGNERVYKVLEEENQKPVHVMNTIDVLYAGGQIRKDLEVEALKPLLQLSGYGYHYSGALLEYHEHIFLPEQIVFLTD